MVARVDQATAPQTRQALLQVRRGTAFYQRTLGALADDQLDEPSLLPGWDRRHVIAHVGYNARAITRLVNWANTGIETPMYASPEQRNAEIDLGATLPAHALRHLDAHAAISLDVEWRDTPQYAWENTIRTAQGRVVPLTETIWMRTREVWLHAIDLRASARIGDIPRPILVRLLGDVVGHWQRTEQGATLRVEVVGDDDQTFGDQADDQTGGDQSWGSGSDLVRGTLPAVTAWATGRVGPPLDRGREFIAPRWI